MLDALSEPGLSAAFGRREERFAHDLTDRDELRLERVAALVDRVPSRWVVAHRAQHDAHEGRGNEPPVDRSRLAEHLRDVDTSEISVRIYNLERVEEWAALAGALDARIREFVGTREGGVRALNLGVFVASPHTVTPAHPDRHHNLLLQVEGHKEIWIGADPDAQRNHLQVLDWLGCPTAGVASLPPATSYVLGPGDGIYIPPYAFHWTRLSDDTGIALSVGFSTPATLRANRVHNFDLILRRRGVMPRPASPTSLRGRTKARLASLADARAARRCDSVSVSSSKGSS